MRTRKGVAMVDVARDFMASSDVDVMDIAQRAIAQQLEEVRGPRGGRYVGEGPITYTVADPGHDFRFASTTVRGERAIRYVRPKR